MESVSIIPILRIFDEHKAREFYVGFLGFTISWEHHFGEDFPLYMEITKGNWVIHLTGHHGDCCPGSAIMLQMTGIEAYQQALVAKQYKHSKPGLEETEWETLEMTISDPFGNRLCFFENRHGGTDPPLG